MAIDTTNEKLALIDFPLAELPISSDGLDQADNQQLLWGYPGLLWSASAPLLIIEGSAKLVKVINGDGAIIDQIDGSCKIVDEITGEGFLRR